MGKMKLKQTTAVEQSIEGYLIFGIPAAIVLIFVIGAMFTFNMGLVSYTSAGSLKPAKTNDYALNFNTKEESVFIGIPDKLEKGDQFTMMFRAQFGTPAKNGSLLTLEGVRGNEIMNVSKTVKREEASKLSINFSNDSDSYKLSTGINDSLWHHYAIVKNGTGEKHYIKFFVDGNLVTKKEVPVNGDQLIHFGGGSLKLGSTKGAPGFRGKINDLLLWNTEALSKKVINDLKGKKINFKAHNLLGAWTFNDKANKRVTDFSGNQLHGEFQNFSTEDNAKRWVICKQAKDQ